jgi:hypothetical protein
MADEVRVSDAPDDETDGMAVAAWATVLTIAVVLVALVLCWLWSMHRAGQGRLPW